MKKIFYIISAASMVLAAACAKEEAPVVNDSTAGLVEMTFKAETDVASKTTLHTDGKSVHWTEGDKISVFAINEGAVVSHTSFMATIDAENPTKADFTGATDAEAADFVALYPYDRNASVSFTDGVATTVRTTIPYIQKAVKGGFDNELNIMLATTDKATSYFSFKNLCSLIKVTIPEEDPNDDTDNDLTQITSLSLNLREPAVGAFIYDLKNGVSLKTGDNPGKTVSLVSEDGSPLEAGDYYFVINSHSAEVYNNALQGITWFCVGLSDGNVKTIANNKQLELSANKIYNMGTLSLAEAKPDLTIDNAPVGRFPMGVKTYQLKWTFNDDNTDNSKVTFSARNTDVATVDPAGLVTFTGKPGAAHVHVNYKSYVYPVVFNVTAGYYRDPSDNWKEDTSGATSSITDGVMTVNLKQQIHNEGQENESCSGRGDVKRQADITYISPEYPILCFRMDDIKLLENAFTGRSIKLDTNYGYVYDSGSTATIWSGAVGNGTDKWSYKANMDDNSMVYAFDITKVDWPNVDANSGYTKRLPTDEIVCFPHFKIVYADVKPWVKDESAASYRFYGYNTFQTLEEAAAYYGKAFTNR